MVRRFQALSLCLVALALLAGCDMIESFLGIGEPDLEISSVQPLSNATTGEITGVRVVLANSGSKDAAAVKVAILLTDDQVVSTANDTQIYETSLDLAIGDEKQLDIANSSVQTWMTDNAATTPANGKYYIGALIDPSDGVNEKDETNNRKEF